MAQTVLGFSMKRVPLSAIKDDLSRFLREPENAGDRPWITPLMRVVVD
jgi:hypothetical protein